MIKRNSVKVLSAVTVSDSVIFFYGLPSYLSKNNFEVAISSANGPELEKIQHDEKPVVFTVAMEREIHIFKDLVSFIKVLFVLAKFRPFIVNAGTPKAGLLYMAASWILRIPRRVYHVRGLRHESLSGFAERLQIKIEKLCGFFATHVVCETLSLKDLAVETKLYPEKKCEVLGPGSSGVNLVNYQPNDYSDIFRSEFKKELGIPVDARVIGFLGRVVPRKGISELLKAWVDIRVKFPDVYLLIAGPLEDAQPLKHEELKILNEDPRIVFVGKVQAAARYYSVMDVFTLPAHWEGFGNVLVEAASMGLPVVTTNGTGTRDAVKEGYNSLVIPVKDSSALFDAISQYLEDDALRAIHGMNGRDWALRFERKVILKHLVDFYESLL